MELEQIVYSLRKIQRNVGKMANDLTIIANCLEEFDEDTTETGSSEFTGTEDEIDILALSPETEPEPEPEIKLPRKK